jgi:hypothetical protein
MEYAGGLQDSEYGQQPYFYPGYGCGYDESGMFVIRKLNIIIYSKFCKQFEFSIQ